ncbi:MAG: DUF2905 domain-containing protein [Gammaproteobacteria bacterium]|nr:DUF2905 domain-containing protein [Gammaproteobacteria bacterium]
MQKLFLVLGLACLALALLWPLLAQLHLRRLPGGRLPGDIRIERDGFRFYFPITGLVLVSLAISLLLRR